MDLITDRAFESMFAKTLEGTRLMLNKTVNIDSEPCDETTPYVFIFNRKNTGIRAFYLSLHPHKGYLLPHIQHVAWARLKGWYVCI